MAEERSHIIVQGSYFEVNLGHNYENPLLVDQSSRQSQLIGNFVLGITCCEVCKNPLMNKDSHVCNMSQSYIYKNARLLSKKRERIEVSMILKTTKLQILQLPKLSTLKRDSAMQNPKVIHDIGLACTKAFAIIGDEPDYPVSIYQAGESQPIVTLNFASLALQSGMVQLLQNAINFATRNAAREALVSRDSARLLFVFHHTRDELDLILPPQNSNDPLSHIAVKSGNMEAMLSMLSVCPDILFLHDQNQMTPLHVACEVANIDMLRLMFDEASNLDIPLISIANIRGHRGRSLMHVAASHEIIEFLLSVECDIDGRDEIGKTPLCLAAENSNAAVVEALINLGSRIDLKCWQYGYNACMWAARKGSTEILSLLVQKDVSVASSSSLSGYTPLHLSARYGHQECVTVLLGLGVDANAQDKAGRTALSHACEGDVCSNPVEMLDLIGSLIVSSSCSLRDHEGRQPLHIAAKNGQAAIVSMIIQSGGEANAIDLEGNTPLELCEIEMCRIKSFDDSEDNLATLNRLSQARDTLVSFGAVKRLHHEIPVEADDIDIMFTKSKDQAYSVSAATPVKMLSRLTSFPFFNQADCKIFLKSYREFMNPVELVSILKARHEALKQLLSNEPQHPSESEFESPSTLTCSVWDDASSNAPSVKHDDERKTEVTDLIDSKRAAHLLRADVLSVMQFVACWKNRYRIDIQENVNLMRELSEFIQDLISMWPGMAREVDLKIPEFSASELRTVPNAPFVASPGICLTKDSFIDIILHCDDVEFSKQLTLLEFGMFQKIKEDELLNLAFQSNPQLLAPNYVILRDFHQSMISMVAGAVLSGESPDQRAKALSKFISIASSCKSKMKNINGVVEIVNALSSTAVYRLKRSWDKVPKRHLQKLQELKSLIHSDNNYGSMRVALRDVELPCMPYVGLFLKDIVSIEQIPSHISVVNASSNETEKKLVNFSKMASIGRILLEFERFQLVSFDMQASELWKDWILKPNLNPYPSSEIRYQRSLALESSSSI